jgi:methyltransferase (TIGR00027 family)
MVPDQPSRTAYRVALRRAAHQLLDRPLVLEDPVAIDVLGPEGAALLRADAGRFERGVVDRYLRAFVVARSRLAEDQLEAARAAGVRQFVILGAGLDTFAYRGRRFEPPLRIWEVDQPATQAWKRQRLQEAAIAIPECVTFVPLDLEHNSAEVGLADAGFDAAAGAVFSWLGVTPYLTARAVFGTLAGIARATGACGGVVFDYMLSPDLLDIRQRRVFDWLADRVETAGETWRSAFEPDRLAVDLRSIGFPVTRDYGPDELNRRYFANRRDGLRVGSIAHVMWAGGDVASAAEGG